MSITDHITEDRRHARKLATRASILEAAERVVLTEGYAALTTKKLVEEAGVSERTVFNHFSSLEDVVISRLADLLTEMFEGNTLQADLGPAELPDAIDNFYRSHITSETGAQALGKFAVLAVALGELDTQTHDALGSTILKTLISLADRVISYGKKVYPDLSPEESFKLTVYTLNLSTGIALGMTKAVFTVCGEEAESIPVDLFSKMPLDDVLSTIRQEIFWTFNQINAGKPVLHF